MYRQRLAPMVKVEDIVLKDEKDLPAMSGTDILVLLDETGNNWSSKDLAGKIATWQQRGTIKSVAFLIGGPYGVSQEVKHAATETWSLSRATFQGDIAWALVWEQIYRAYSIIKGTGYHHE